MSFTETWQKIKKHYQKRIVHSIHTLLRLKNVGYGSSSLLVGLTVNRPSASQPGSGPWVPVPVKSAVVPRTIHFLGGFFEAKGWGRGVGDKSRGSHLFPRRMQQQSAPSPMDGRTQDSPGCQQTASHGGGHMGSCIRQWTQVTVFNPQTPW